ncbi:uncharacterized protein LOC116140995 [Pistacia vera]|uniref:uncharacterized protein LOC116140995 n=1 Tax=Pistacia vera TaxID=55513 RepID=UPI001262CED5|nr:uncharacterized protein LOC116140995 [Pistacia vera]
MEAEVVAYYEVVSQASWLRQFITDLKVFNTQLCASLKHMFNLKTVVYNNTLVLERFDEKAFFSTPLHTAVREGKIRFAKEIVNLKPSFVCMRDHLGRSSLHLALEGRHGELRERNPPPLALEERYQEMEGRGPPDLDLEKYQELVTWLIKIHPELVRVKAKGMVTPLHYAAQIDDEFNLADFLYVCPSSIEDLTVKSETGVHVAIKNRSFKAFKVLLGWLRRFDKEDILKWEDEEGNNALHTAISANQAEVVKLLIKYMDVNGVNDKGLTALDIFYDLQHSLNPEVKQILLGAKAKRASKLNLLNLKTIVIYRLFRSKNLFVRYLCWDLNPVEVIIKSTGFGNLIINRIPLEVQNAVLVVAILIATATYQAALSPPGGNWQDESQVATNNTSVIKNTSAVSLYNIFLNPTFFYRGRSQQQAGHMIQGTPSHFCFLIYNTVAFSSSVCTIIVLVSRFPFFKIIGFSTTLIVLAYCYAVIETSPYPVGSGLWFAFIYLIAIIGPLAYLIPFFLYLRDWMVKLCGRGQLRMGSFEQPKM